MVLMWRVSQMYKTNHWCDFSQQLKLVGYLVHDTEYVMLILNDNMGWLFYGRKKLFKFHIYFFDEENLKAYNFHNLFFISHPFLKGYTLWPTPWNAGSKTFAVLDIAKCSFFDKHLLQMPNPLQKKYKFKNK